MRRNSNAHSEIRTQKRFWVPTGFRGKFLARAVPILAVPILARPILARLILAVPILAVPILTVPILTVLAPHPAVGEQQMPSASNLLETPMGDVRLVSAVSGTGGLDIVPLALHFRLKEDWKIYWRTPGDAGFPPELEIQAADNLDRLEWRWPAPRRFSQFGFENYGYGGEVAIPISAILTRPAAPLVIDARLRALACAEICVPMEGRLTLDLGGDAAGPTAFTQLIDRYRARIPRSTPPRGLTVTRAVAKTQASLALSITSDQPLDNPDVFVEAASGFGFSPPVVEIAAAGKSATLTLAARIPDGRRLQGMPVTLTLVDGARASETALTIGPASDPASGSASDKTSGSASDTTSDTLAAAAGGSAEGLSAAGMSAGLWLTMIGFALLGGFILNLMPCVLPVLALKLVHAVEYGGEEKGRIRAGFLASAAGILASFMLLAAAAALLRAGGYSVGWGIQFQQPLFLAGMVVLLTGFAANLFGWFEIPLPRLFRPLGTVGLGTVGLGRTGSGGASSGGAGSGEDKSRLVGHFFTGAFATLLATPCSAPFLGTALGFAFSSETSTIFAIFAAMGVGLAAPWLMAALAPGLVRMLPRPGRWMVWLRRGLGLALLGTVVWLLTVLAELSAMPRLILLILCLGAGLAALAFGHKFERRFGHKFGPFLRRGALSLAGVLAIAGFLAVGLAEAPAPDAPSISAPSAKWRGFDAAEITRLVAAGETVFVDVTAEWCLTCLVNKSVVLNRAPVADILAGDGVVAMRADWTAPDPRITRYLASFQRYGIPFNAVYGPHARTGLILPELLTVEAVLDALAKASGAKASEKAPGVKDL